MDWLKEMLGKYVEADKVDAVIDEINKEMPKYNVPKGRFNELNEELKVTKTQAEEMKKSIEDLSKKASTADEYQKTIADLQAKNKKIEEDASLQIAQITKKSQLKELLMTNNAHKDALDLLVEKYVPEVQVDEKGLKDADKLLAKIKEEKAGLFIVTKVDSNDKNQNTNPNSKLPKTDEEQLKKSFGL